jgi:hypothetical protein
MWLFSIWRFFKHSSFVLVLVLSLQSLGYPVSIDELEKLKMLIGKENKDAIHEIQRLVYKEKIAKHILFLAQIKKTIQKESDLMAVVCVFFIPFTIPHIFTFMEEESHQRSKSRHSNSNIGKNHVRSSGYGILLLVIDLLIKHKTLNDFLLSGF